MEDRQSRLSNSASEKVVIYIPLLNLPGQSKYYIKLYLHGNGMGRSAHFSILLALMKLEYNVILK